MNHRLVLLFMVTASALLGNAHAISADVVHRDAWSFDRSFLEWESDAAADTQKKAGNLKFVEGWVEYDFECPADDWYELWQTGLPATWTHDIYLDGTQVLSFATSDEQRDVDPDKAGWFKDGNFYLVKGKHTMRIRRLNNPGGLPSAWEMRRAMGDPAGSIRVVDAGEHAVRVGDRVSLKVEGGSPAATSYELVSRNETTDELLHLGNVAFPASDTPLEKTVEVQFVGQGVFEVLARVGDKVLRPADLKAGEFAVIDTGHPPEPPAELKTTNVVNIDCAAEPPKEGFWEKDGKTTVRDTPLGKYRESSGQGSAEFWGTDGYSYRFDLPEAGRLYRLRVDYPDDDRRSMGFWINDGANTSAAFMGVTNGGGVETGDHYALTQKMLTYQAFFYPRKDKGLIVAVLNLVPGMKAAAARIRIDVVDSPLPAAPLGATGGRDMGFYFEEPGRWLRFFGGENKEVSEDIKTMERWGQWNRYIGANLMFPTVNVYQGNHYPSRVLEGYFSTQLNETRLAALMAEKYHSDFIPEFHLSGQKWFDKHVMGVWADKTLVDGIPGATIHFATREAEECVTRDRDGGYELGAKPFGYNALNPRVQQMYIDVFGELADTLKDCKSFVGISSRMMLSWQYQGWNTVEGLNWGYDDWTIAQFTKDTGIAVPGSAGDPKRFRQRFDFLTGTTLDKWLAWRCAKIFDYHKRLLARIQQAKPDAKLFFTYSRPDPKTSYSPKISDQLMVAGVDLKLYEKVPGIVIMPNVNFGRRYSTPIGDAEAMQGLNDPGVKELARSGDRGICIFSNYYEVNKHLDWTKLGGVDYPAFDACVPSDINEREWYAIAMADSDCSYLAMGGNGWIFGNPDLMQPFLREYRALPARRFERFEKAIDPVAIWNFRDDDGDLWFYAVNRLRVPVVAKLSFSAGSGDILAAVDGAKLSTQDGKLRVPLEPFMMRSFRLAKGDLADCQVETPQNYIESLKPQIDAARIFRDDLIARRIGPEMTREDVDVVTEQLDKAIAAFGSGKYWLAHSELESLAITRIEYASGRFLSGVLQRSQPMGVPNFSDAAPVGFKTIADSESEQTESAISSPRDAEGNQWVAYGDTVYEFGSDGKWKRRLSLFAPFAFDRRENYDRGDLREATLYPAVPFAPRVLFSLPGNRLLAQQGMEPPVVFDTETGRAKRLKLGNKFNVAGPSSLLAVTPQGEVLLSTKSGVSAFDPDGTWIRNLSDSGAASGGKTAAGTKVPLPLLDGYTQLKVWDGRLYFLSRGKVMRLTPGEGSQADQVEMAFDPNFPAGAEAFAFAANGDLFLASTSGGEIYRCKRDGAGWGAPDKIAGTGGSGGLMTDLAVDGTGALLLRTVGGHEAHGANVTLSRVNPGAAPAPLIDLGSSTVSPGEYGLYEKDDGTLLIAGGNLRGIWHLAADGRVIWKTQRQKSCPPGYADLRCPLGITSDSKGGVWATDPTRHQILHFDENGKFLQALGSFGDGSDANRLSLDKPLGIATLKDPSGREWIYVADTGNGRIVKWPILP